MRQTSLEAAVRAAVGNGVPGVTVIVVSGEGVLARVAVGVADVISGEPMRSSLAVPWFSMTKIATATVAVRLSEKGLLDLDQPIGSLVPAMEAVKPVGWAARITARHLLQHTAGFRNPIPIRWIHPAARAGPDPDLLLERLLARHARLRFAPGTRSSYSNLGALVLGAAIAAVAGTTYETAVHDELLGPLGMAGTGFGYRAPGLAATGHHPRWSPLRALLPRWVRGRSSGRWMTLRPFVVDGAAYGGLIGTPEEAARIVQMHVRGGELDGVRIISERAASQMRQITAQGNRYDLGLGWLRPAKWSKTAPEFVEHLGGGAGFYNTMRIYPSHGIGVLVTGNATSYPLETITRAALRATDTRATGADRLLHHV